MPTLNHPPHPSAPPQRGAPILNESHPVHQLMLGTLQKAGGLLQDGTVVHPNIKLDDVRFGLSRLGAGLDHTVGEQVLVFADFSPDPKRNSLTRFLMVTDRRFVGTPSWHTGELCHVRFSEIDEVRYKKGMLSYQLQVRAGQAWHDLSYSELDIQIRDFLRPLMNEPKENREPRPRPLCHPTEDDPTGATLALSWMPVPDSRTALILSYLREAARQGKMPVEIAQDFVARVTLAYRNLCFGRGQHEGRFMSPVSSNDLSQLMVHMFGNPLRQEEHPVRTLLLPSQMRSDAGAAALSSAVGLASAALLGVGWTRRARPSVASFVFQVADTGAFTSYRLMQSDGSTWLNRKVPVLVDDIQYNLMSLEEALLLRRCVFGWNTAPIELMRADPSELLARLTDAVGPFDPQVLGRTV